MTTADPTRQWCVEATELLRDTAVRAARLASAVTIDWLDPDGRAWAERIDALRREPRRDRPRGRRPGSAAADTVRLVAAAGTRYGPRLGDTSGARVDDAHGVQIAQLPDPPTP